MRHTLAFNDQYGVYMCTVCGAGFTQDALIVEMDGTGCPGPKANEGYTSTPLDNPQIGVFWYRGTPDAFYSWESTGPATLQPYSGLEPYEDCETKGRRLLKSAGYDDDEGGEI